MKKKRKSIPQSIRFEVFKRDSFTCQYCGRKAPDVILEVDHIEPFSKGGGDDIFNLITSCKDCNIGKSNKRISDDSVVSRQHAQLNELQERKNQIEMMFDWKKSLLSVDDFTVEKLCEYFSDAVGNLVRITENGQAVVRKALSKYNVDDIVSAIDTSVDHYFNGDIASAQIAFDKINGILFNRKRYSNDPDLQRLHYICGIMKNRFSYYDKQKAIIMLEEARRAKVPINLIEYLAKECKNWSQFRSAIDESISVYTQEV